MSGIPWRIPGPSPQPPLHTLLSSVRIVDDLDAAQVERWLNGVVVYPSPPGPVHGHDGCATGSSRDKDAGETVPTPRFDAITVYLADTCSAAGIFGAGLSAEEAQARFVARATEAFVAMESAGVEEQLMAGTTIGLNPYLADGEGTFPHASTAVDVVEAFASLENEIAVSARRGMIHCSPALALKASSENILVEDNDVLRTRNGNIVVPGDGYVGHSAPVGHTAPTGVQEWAYATGPVEVRRSDVLVMPGLLSEALDRETNTITYRVERYYVVDWDTVIQAAVRVDRSIVL